MRLVFPAIAILSTLAATDASAQALSVNLSGRWQCVAQCVAPPNTYSYIAQNGWELNMVNGDGLRRAPGSTIPGASGSTLPTRARSIRPTATRSSSIAERSGSAPRCAAAAGSHAVRPQLCS